MNIQRVIGSGLLILLLLAFCLNLNAAADPMEHSVPMGSMRSEAGFYRLGLEVVQGHDWSLNRPAAVTAADFWRKKNIAIIWARRYPGARTLTRKTLEEVLVGNFQAVPPEFAAMVMPIVGGWPTLALSSVGMLFRGTPSSGTPSSGEIFLACTATLLGPDHILTARHCIEPYICNVDPVSSVKVFFQYEGIRELAVENGCYVTSLFCESDDTTCSTTTDDLAKVKLADPFIVIPEASLPKFHWPIYKQPYDSGVIAGYGKASNNSGNPDSGILRTSGVNIKECECPDELYVAKEAGRAICFQYKDALSDVGIEAGDSGGPMFSSAFLKNEMIGVARASAACPESNGYYPVEAKYVDLSHYGYWSWLSSTFESDVDSPYTSGNGVVDFYDLVPLSHLGGGQSQNHDLSLGTGISKLIVTLNHEIAFNQEPYDLDMEISGLTPDCHRYMGVEVCSVLHPGPGTYTIRISQGDCGPDLNCYPPNDPNYQLAALALHCTNWFCEQLVRKPVLRFVPPFRVPDF